MTMLPLIAALSSLATGDLLTRLPDHPRLLLPRHPLERVRAQIASDPAARAVHAALATHAARLRSEPLELATGLPSRVILDRLWTFAFRWRLDGDRASADQGVADLLRVVRLPTWRPEEFLLTAETMHGVAIALDWLWDVLAPGEREEIQRALVTLGLMPAERAYAVRPFWVRDTCNWNTVCNTAVILAAIAAAETDPRRAERCLHQALGSVQYSLPTFAPDGGWPEGPGYWGFAMRYLSVLIEAVHGACGSALGLDLLPGIACAADFRIHCEGPTGKLFNFADGAEPALPDPSLMWCARRFGRPAYAAAARQALAGLDGSPTYAAAARALLWWDSRGGPVEVAALPLDARFAAVDVACFRSSWNDRRATWAAIKGGDIQANHAHADLGSFVIDAGGQRWLFDPGPDDYSLPGYWNGRPDSDLARWGWHRNATRGHNCLLVGDAEQALLGHAAMIGYVSSGHGGMAIVDLTSAYSGARRVRRGLALAEGRTAIWIRDELDLEAGTGAAWLGHTEAMVEVEGLQARLRLGDVERTLTFSCSEAASLTVEEIDLAPPQRSLRCRRLVLRTLAGADVLRIAARFAAEGGVPDTGPLAGWGARFSGG